ncbi:MAG: hypothetical protein V4574_02150 [Pseudomonadota bacterium]
MQLGFVTASVLMGLGIAVDVAIATVLRFRDSGLTFKSWTMPVAVAHVLLPAIGYYGWWLLGHEFDELKIILGLAAFLMIGIFVYESFCEWIAAKPVITLDPLTGWALSKLGATANGRMVVIFAVSLDALWSGPAKAAQAESGHWTPVEVLVSFLIAGVVVAIVSELSLLLALLLRRISFNDLRLLARYLVAAKYLEATILFSFGILSLWNALSFWIGLGELHLSITASAGLMLVLWLSYWKRLLREQTAEFETSAKGESNGP